MTNDTKDLLMQYLGRIADHCEITDSQNYTFKKRTGLMDKVKEKDPEAFVVIDELISAFVKEDRIRNDKEKFDKARTLWESEHANAEKDKVETEMHLIKFFTQKNIPIGSKSLSV